MDVVTHLFYIKHETVRSFHETATHVHTDCTTHRHKPISQEAGLLLSISLRPMKYQTHAIQWASRANVDMSRVRTTALYWE